MNEERFAGILAFLVLKLVGYAVAARVVGRLYTNRQPAEVPVSVLRTGVGWLAGIVYAPVMEKLQWTPWSDPGRSGIFLLAIIPLSVLFWWWCIMWFYHRKAQRNKPLLKSVAASVAISSATDVVAVLGLPPLRNFWVL